MVEACAPKLGTRIQEIRSCSRPLVTFLTNPYFDFDKEELARELGMSKQTVYKNFKDLEELGVVKVSRKIGRATMYRIDSNYPLIKTLNESVNEASFQIAKQERKQKIPVTATG
jgi:biotin operon repressor